MSSDSSEFNAAVPGDGEENQLLVDEIAVRNLLNVHVQERACVPTKRQGLAKSENDARTGHMILHPNLARVRALLAESQRDGAVVVLGLPLEVNLVTLEVGEVLLRLRRGAGSQTCQQMENIK